MTTEPINSNQSPAAPETEKPVSSAKATEGLRGGKPGGTGPKGGKAARKPTPAATKAPGTGKGGAPKVRTDTKQAKLVAMLKETDGATVEEIVAAFDWQAHTVRGALYGALKTKLGLNVTSEKVEGRGRVYRIGS